MRPVELVWSGGEHPFLLRIGELRALQSKCEAGPAWIMTRLLSGQWMVDDVVETIRLGLIGGGMEEKEARKVVNECVGDGAYQRNVVTAAAILRISIMGEADDPVGETEAGETTETGSLAENSGSPVSTSPPSGSE